VGEWERAAADPDHAAANAATLADALKHFLKDRANKGRAEGTLKCYRVKAGHLLRVLRGDTRLSQIDARAVDLYVETRLEEGAARHTVQKELVTLRGTLKVAKRRGEYRRDITGVMPDGFSAGYKPKSRFLPGSEAQRLLAELGPDRAARVAFILATGARWRESERAMRADIDWQRGTVRLHGTKTATAERVVPIVGASNDLLVHVERYAEGTEGRLFDAQSAISAAHAFAPVSPNDLRRTYATWLHQHGTEPHLIGAALGHGDSRMVERVYGRMPVESLGRALAERVGDCSAFVATPRKTLRSVGAVDGLDRQDSSEKLVPRDGIEPPTRGFSKVYAAITSIRKRGVSGD
jgi:integrase